VAGWKVNGIVGSWLCDAIDGKADGASNWKCKGSSSGDMWSVDANSTILGREVKDGAGVSW
jgi:hypothetical protein